MFCENCGKKLNKKQKFCTNCGKSLETTVESKKVPGKGISIAGMILGIVAIVWTSFELISSPNIFDALNEIAYKSNPYINLSFLHFWFAFGYTILALIPSLVGLPLSIVGCVKQRSGNNITGLILNSIALFASLTVFIYIMLLAY